MMIHQCLIFNRKNAWAIITFVLLTVSSVVGTTVVAVSNFNNQSTRTATLETELQAFEKNQREKDQQIFELLTESKNDRKEIRILMSNISVMLAKLEQKLDLKLGGK